MRLQHYQERTRATAGPLAEETFEEDANHKATDALLAALQAHHRPDEVRNANVR